ncbi:MAG: cytochrome c maturation protein CcmE [Alphaproteobacteria bacterium]|nr:cytochrome c maturation protein CcmE [Alphaproteobacteria bacterium]NCQ67195.1 cytochrome c maturation protein CcmE [Alphaproteobacteria bacterium]NCT07039.1 cytochrome c maturation protein CcmE [Alphaproteobacteria bacterium]
MKKSVARRLLVTLVLVTLLSGTLYLVMQNFRDNLVFFFSPTEVLDTPEKASKRARLGGMIKEGSVKIVSKSEHRLRFAVTDFNKEVAVEYQGFLPDLFREGQGLVAEGYFDQKSQIFMARTILAKHDATYMPPQVEEVLDRHHGKDSLAQNKQDSQGQVSR